VPIGKSTRAVHTAAIAACLVLPGIGHAQMFKCFDATGQITYSDSACVSSVPQRPGQAEIGTINRQQALGFMASFDKALARLDFERMLDHFADDAVIHVRVKSQRGGGSMAVGKAEFRRRLYEAKDRLWDYRLQRSNVEIKVLPDGTQAEVQSDLTEWWRDPGGAMTVKSRETYIVELRRGRPKASGLQVVTRDPEPQVRQQP
jgi:ketosteroid isomerase-like protein